MKLELTPAAKLSIYSHEEGECLVWDRCRTGARYGQLYVDGKVLLTHRIAWEAFMGKIPKGQCVLHKCDNPPCWRKEHLFLGTKADNTQDMMKKGRHGCQVDSSYIQRGDAHYSRTNPERRVRGAKHGMAKLSEQDVMQIRWDFANGKHTKSEIANIRKMSKSQIGDIVNRKTWKHLEEPTVPTS